MIPPDVLTEEAMEWIADGVCDRLRTRYPSGQWNESAIRASVYGALGAARTPVSRFVVEIRAESLSAATDLLPLGRDNVAVVEWAYGADPPPPRLRD
jgi:hypothetical protein